MFNVILSSAVLIYYCIDLPSFVKVYSVSSLNRWPKYDKLFMLYFVKYLMNIRGVWPNQHSLFTYLFQPLQVFAIVKNSRDDSRTMTHFPRMPKSC